MTPYTRVVLPCTKERTVKTLTISPAKLSRGHTGRIHQPAGSGPPQNLPRPELATERIQTVLLLPYGNRNPRFSLTLWQTCNPDVVAYRLTIRDAQGKRVVAQGHCPPPSNLARLVEREICDNPAFEHSPALLAYMQRTYHNETHSLV